LKEADAVAEAPEPPPYRCSTGGRSGHLAGTADTDRPRGPERLGGGSGGGPRRRRARPPAATAC